MLFITQNNDNNHQDENFWPLNIQLVKFSQTAL